jgi:hypothetical protein
LNLNNKLVSRNARTNPSKTRIQKTPQKKAPFFYLALQAIKTTQPCVNKNPISCTSLIHKCALVKILVFSRTKNAQMEFFNPLGTDFE